MRGPPSMSELKDWRPAPEAASLLLPVGTPVEFGDYTAPAIGTGIIPIIGSARSGKTTLALTLMDWATQTTDRPLFFLGMPDAYIEALPRRLRGRSSNPPISDLASLRDGIALLDDTAVSFNSRDSSRKDNRGLSRVAGVLSHFGLTVILTLQSGAGIDVSLMRYTMLAPLVKRVDQFAGRFERAVIADEVAEAQHDLAAAGFDRSLYVSLKDSRLCRHPAPEWVLSSDVLSRPFRYLEQAQVDELVG